MNHTTRTSELGMAQLSSTFARIYGMLLDADQAEHAVHQLSKAARDTIASAVGAGASLMDSTGTCLSKGTTDKMATLADELQYEFGEGPCLSAWSSLAVQRIDDMARESRWSTWCPAALELGLQSMISVPMMYQGVAIGALKVYSVAPDAFTVHDEQQLALLAEAAATLLGAAQSVDAPKELNGALKSVLADRRTVETATGMLMERHRMDHDSARELLLVTSRRLRRPLVELARGVVTRSSDVSL